MCCRLELQNKSHLAKGECGDGTGRKGFPLSHKKREKESAIAGGMKAYCGLEGNYGEGERRHDKKRGKGRGDRSEERATGRGERARQL